MPCILYYHPLSLKCKIILFLHCRDDKRHANQDLGDLLNKSSFIFLKNDFTKTSLAVTTGWTLFTVIQFSIYKHFTSNRLDICHPISMCVNTMHALSVSIYTDIYLHNVQPYPLNCNQLQYVHGMAPICWTKQPKCKTVK